jgi:hypothetical protein
MKILAIVMVSLMLLACGGGESSSTNSTGSPTAFDPPPSPGK